MHSLDALLALCERYMPRSDLALIRSAYEAAARAHEGVCRKSGEPYIDHPLAVACTLAELAVDARGVAAALLHDTVEDTPLSLEALHAQFGPEIAAIVDGVTKFSAVESPEPGETGEEHTGAARAEGDSSSVQRPAPATPATPSASVQPTREQKARAHAETVHKLLLAMLRDPRVVLLKLADRLHNMRTMAVMSPRQRAVKSQEVLDIYAPLAGRIGLYNFKGELEDHAFRYLHPEEFERTVKALRAEEERRHDWAERMCERVRHELWESGISAAVSWRMKRPYRAWVESQESGIRVAALNDLITFRVLVESVPECYRALGEIHRLWMPHERIRDYIANTKNNGYQSLHTAVFALDGHLAPIHIRTHRMHRASQHGVATNWLERAAHGEPIRSGESLVRQMPAWVNQLANWEGDLKLDAEDFLSAVRGEMLEEDSVFVFTPGGDVHELPAGATVLDLAYRIHTRIGDQAVGAQIQTTTREGATIMREVAIDYQLQTSDVVYIRTNLRSRPRPEWRSMAVTRYAQEKINRGLRLARRGRSELGLERPAATAPNMAWSVEPSAESEPEPPTEAPVEAPRGLRHPSGKPAKPRLARCCYPCPTDEILGVPGEGSTITIHRRCCRTLRRILERRAATGADGTNGANGAHARPVSAAPAGEEPAEAGSVGKGSIGKGSIGKGSIGKGSIGKGSIGKGSIGKGSIGKDGHAEAPGVGADGRNRVSATAAATSPTPTSPTPTSPTEASLEAAGFPSVRWEELGAIPYRLHLAIYGHDHRGLMHEVSKCVASLGLNVVYTKASANQDRSAALISLTVDVPTGVRRDVVIRRLRAVPGVTAVERDTRRGCDEADARTESRGPTSAPAAIS